MKRLYLYLASRSKQGIKLITVLQGESIVTSRVTDLSNLKLPQIWERRIYQIIYDNRMLYEPWIEAATDFNELRPPRGTRLQRHPDGGVSTPAHGGLRQGPESRHFFLPDQKNHAAQALLV